MGLSKSAKNLMESRSIKGDVNRGAFITAGPESVLDLHQLSITLASKLLGKRCPGFIIPADSIGT